MQQLSAVFYPNRLGLVQYPDPIDYASFFDVRGKRLVSHEVVEVRTLTPWELEEINENFESEIPDLQSIDAAARVTVEATYEGPEPGTKAYIFWFIQEEDMDPWELSFVDCY